MKLARSTLTAIAPIPHDRVAPLSATEAPGIGSADGTAQAASEALATLDAVRRSGSDGGKARAAARIGELKTRLHLLKLLHAADAEKLAQAAAQIARELAEAVQEYVGAGGTAFAVQGTEVTIVGGANLTPTPAPAEDVPQDPAGATGNAARSEAQVTPAAGTATRTRSEAGRRGAAAHPDDGADDAAFANDARALANEVRAILRRAERQHGADDHDAARGSLNDIDRAMAVMSQMPAAYDAAVARLASVASGAATIFARG
ncbi:hypothetical protein [Sphingomonas sp. 2SG]|uniref:hypothetical protein n=1 Tax=Sphingomonas sp. 2SG TaxID=2502201 RepID=UPI0010F5B203|nr:hypothetical protein [Sphingomonas sp. 2SG]